MPLNDVGYVLRCIISQFCRAKIIECIYTSLDGTAYYMVHLGYMVLLIAPRLQASTACYCREEHKIK